MVIVAGEDAVSVVVDTHRYSMCLDDLFDGGEVAEGGFCRYEVGIYEFAVGIIEACDEAT